MTKELPELYADLKNAESALDDAEKVVADKLSALNSAKRELAICMKGLGLDLGAVTTSARQATKSTRGPRSESARFATSTTRIIRAAHADGKTAKEATTSALAAATKLAKGGALPDGVEEAVIAKVKETYGRR